MNAPARSILRPPAIAFHALVRLVALMLGATASLTAAAQSVAATVTAAPLPYGIAVNTVTNKIYVTSYIDKGQVTVIDGATNATTAIPVGSFPSGIDVNMVTNKVYVANGASNSVTVIDGATNATTTIPVGINPTAVAVNPVTNTIFVVNNNLDGTISVINGASNAVTGNIFAGFNPKAVAVDTAKNFIFAIAGSNNTFTTVDPNVYLIDIATGNMVIAEGGTKPVALAVNTTSDQLYVANFENDAFVVAIASAQKGEGGYGPLPVGGTSLAVNTVTNKAYFTEGNAVAEVDGSTLAFSIIPVGVNGLAGIAVDPSTNTVYAASAMDPGFVAAIDASTGRVTLIATGAYPSVIGVNPVTHRVYVLNNDAAGTVTILDGPTGAIAPAFTSEPQPQTINPGSTVVFNAVANASPDPTYQWFFNGLPLSDGNGVSGSAGPILVLVNVSPANAGAYACRATNASGSATSASASLTVAAAADPAHIVNLSTRAYISGGSPAVLIAGFVIGGAGPKPVIIRGIGPALAGFGLSGVIDLPSLALYDSASPAHLITRDSAWQTPPDAPAVAPWKGNLTPADATAADFARVGAFALPAGSSDTALKVSLPAGAYTSQVTAADGTTGVALAEIYDDDPGSPGSRLINISSRAFVGDGGNLMIAGFVIAGSGSETVLIRASGPALSALGVTAAAIVTHLQLNDSGGNPIASNERWRGDPQVAATASRVGAFDWTDPGSGDSALLVTLPPGSYTAEVDALGFGGTALVEVYAVP